MPKVLGIPDIGLCHVVHVEIAWTVEVSWDAFWASRLPNDRQRCLCAVSEYRKDSG